MVFPLFVGSGRSGTTMFGLMFDSHPDLAITHEAHFIAALPARQPSLLDPDRFDAALFVRLLYADPNFVRLGLTEVDVFESLQAHEAREYAGAVRAVMGLYATSKGKRWYGDKTPGYVIHLDQLGQLFPEAKFVHIIRDGRDVALAYVERPEWGPRTVAEAAFYWRSRVARGRASGQRLGPNRYREVRYEDFLDEPAAVAAQLCEFLGIAFHSSMMNYHERGSSFASSSKDPQAFTSLAKPPTKGLRDWRKDMQPADRRLFEAIAGHLLRDLGYETSGKPPSISSRARVAVAMGAWELRRLRVQLDRLARRAKG